jgi:hypothetical protein
MRIIKFLNNAMLHPARPRSGEVGYRIGQGQSMDPFFPPPLGAFPTTSYGFSTSRLVAELARLGW